MRPDGNGRPPLDQDDVVRVPVDLLAEPGVTGGTLRVYGAIRSRVGFEPAAENFLVAYLKVDTIARDAGCSRDTVIRAVAWLENLDFVLHERRPNRSSIFIVVVWRAWFRDLVRQHGSRAEAIRLLRRRMVGAGDASRRDQARAAGERSGRQEWASGRKSHPYDRPGDGEVRKSHPYDRPGSGDATEQVAGTLPRSEDQEIRVIEIRGAPGGAPLALVPSREPDREVARKFLAEIREKAAKT